MVVLVQRRPAPVAAAANLLLDSEANSADSFRRKRFRWPWQLADMFVSAAAQLYVGEAKAQVSAVHTLADVADASASTPRQQCVDVLCGYLRLPRAVGRLGAYDRTVRRTIASVIAEHLRRGARRSWSRAAFDFRNARFEDADFTDAVFDGPAIFEGADLAGITRFDRATFSADTHFQDATFDTVWFREAVFTDSARFFGARFARARFDGTTFRGSAQFPLAIFAGDARFHRAAFRGGAYFDSAQFRGHADFGAAGFTGPARFDGAAFTVDSSFERARFHDLIPSEEPPAGWFTAPGPHEVAHRVPVAACR
ncbi:pentapeptide repeat-containing protein [Nocardia sp. BSTN01]|uniref:pentapeptide repeat-containing protein n=1 Tax=Nocardia sp. BSTN01 TaxID=2783665 RepID=UPI00188E5093|nr:pentapeptide repeat-containing protein [Nocardia sp. BSTN01]MBF4998367.1 pentapeptide repeat-containing protein [Nocardia sp. BSTN01]